jgi:hypothetical protein
MAGNDKNEFPLNQQLLLPEHPALFGTAIPGLPESRNSF